RGNRHRASLSILTPVVGIPELQTISIKGREASRWRCRLSISRICRAVGSSRTFRRSGQSGQKVLRRLKLGGILPGAGRRAPDSFDFMLDVADAVFRVRVVAEKLDCAPLALSLNFFEKFDHSLGIVSAIVKDLRSHEIRLAFGITRIFQKQRIEPE